MTNKNKTLLSLAAIVIIGGVAAFASNTETFQGFMRSRDRGETNQQQSGGEGGSGSGGGSTSESDNQSSDSSIKWWCVKENTGESSGSPDTVPPEGTDPDNESSEETSTETETEDLPGTQESDSKNSFILIDPTVLKTIKDNRLKIIIQMFNNDQSMLVPNPKGSTPGKGKDRTPKPGGEPKPQKVIINYECSCNASTFTIPELQGYIFWCPEKFEEEIETSTATWTELANGKEYTINATKPQSGTCQEGLKENEKIVVGHTCGCDETTFFIKELNKTFECPTYNSGKTYTGENYYVYASKAPIYECEPQWECPEGYKKDWKKVNDDCQQLKKDKCSGNTSDAHVELACKAFEQKLMEMECLDFEDCEKTKELDAKYKGQGTPEIEAAGLPSTTDCKEQFGESGENPSNFTNDWWKD